MCHWLCLHDKRCKHPSFHSFHSIPNILTYFMSIYGRLDFRKPKGLFLSSVLLLGCISWHSLGLEFTAWSVSFRSLNSFFPYIVAYSIVMSPLALVEELIFFWVAEVFLRYILSQLGIVIGFLGVVIQPSIKTSCCSWFCVGCHTSFVFFRTIGCSAVFNIDVKICSYFNADFLPVWIQINYYHKLWGKCGGWMDGQVFLWWILLLRYLDMVQRVAAK